MADPRYKALLIGNSRFPLDGNLRALEGPVNDVVELRNALTHPDVGLFQRGAVRVLPERTAQDILVELQRFFDAASRDDVLLLYYSGHGLLDTRNQLFLCAGDTRTDLLRATAVSNRQVNEMIDDSAARTTIIVLDCCYSGAFKGADLPAGLKGSGRFVLTSCRGAELANDTDQANHTSLFTQHVVDGLLSGAADHDGDGYVVLDELYDYAHRQIDALQPQRPLPQRNFSGGGDVVIARRPPPAPGSSQQPVLDLSETLIDLGDVRPDERLPPQRIEVRNRGGGRLDWSATTTADWLDVDCHDGYFTVRVHPKSGQNRGEIVVRDRMTGATKTVTVRAHVLAPPKLEVSETTIDFGTLQLGTVPPHRVVHLRNTGGGLLEPQVTTSHHWLKALRVGAQVAVSIDTATAGRLAGVVEISSQGGSAQISVTAVVAPSPPARAVPETRDRPKQPPTWSRGLMGGIAAGVVVLGLVVSLLLTRGPGPSPDTVALPGASPSIRTTEPPAPETGHVPAITAAGLRVALNKLLSEHVFLAAMATQNALGGNTPGFEAAAAALGGNTEDLAGLV
ncbi:MAG: caspase, EACC1-associated type, partial [Egibacteraceae bacterium]